MVTALQTKKTSSALYIDRESETPVCVSAFAPLHLHFAVLFVKKKEGITAFSTSRIHNSALRAPSLPLSAHIHPHHLHAHT